MSTPSNLVVKIGLDTASVTTQKAVLSAELKDIQAQLNAAAKQFQAAGDSVDEFGNSIKSKLLAQLEYLGPQVAEAKSALAGLTPAMDAVGHSSAGARRELIVLGHELAMGNYSRLGGSLSVLAEKMGGIGSGALAAAGGVAALGYATYEAVQAWAQMAQVIKDAQGSLIAIGHLSTDSAAETGAWIQELKQNFGASTEEAAKSVNAIRSIGGAASGMQHDLLQLAASIHTLHPDTELSKQTEEIAKAANGGAESFLKWADNSHMLTEEQRQLVESMVKTAPIQALQKTIDILNDSFGNQAQSIAAANKQLKEYFALSEQMGEAGMVPESFGVTLPSDKQIQVQPTAPPRNEALEAEKKVVADTVPELAKIAEVRERIVTLTKAEADGVAGAKDAITAAQQELAKIHLPTDTVQHDRTIESLRSELALAKENGAQRIAISRQIAAAESAFYGADSSEARAAAVEVARVQAEAQQKGVEDAKRAAEQKKAADREWFQDYGDGIKRQITEAADNFDKQRTLAQAWVDTGKALYGEDVRNYQAAIDEKARIDKEAADQRFELADKPLRTQFADQQRSSAAQLSALGQTDRQGLLGSPEQEQQAAQQIVQVDLAALKQIEDARKALVAQLYQDDPAKAKEAAQEITDQFTEAQQAAADKIVEINAKAASEVKKEWQGINGSIGSELASAITSGGKGGFGAAIGNYLKESLTKGLGDVFTNSLGSIEKLIGLGGTSPGGLLQSGLSAIGLGGVGKFIGLGGDAAGAGGQAAATAGLTTAATGLNTSAVSLNTAGVALNTAAAALTTAAAASGASSAIGAASGSGGIAADAVKFAFNDLTPFAAGTSYVPRTMPALIHAGEMVIPAMQAATLRSGGSLDFSGLHYSPPAALTNISTGRTGLSQSSFSSSVDNSRGDTHNYNFRQTNHVQTASDADHASEISRMSSRELQRFVRQNMK